MVVDEPESVKKEPEAPKAKGSLRKAIALTVVVLLTIAATFAGGIFFGPKVGSKLRMPGYEAAEKPVPEESAPGITKALDPVVVDLVGADGVLHHIKVGIAVELESGVKAEEFDKYAPRARDASISYLRALDYEKVTKPAEFCAIREEIGDRVKKAVGEHRARRVLFTDFVVQ
jgi:flagellar basal body-associated protein FliL